MRHDTDVDVVPVTSHDPLRHSMVILPQHVFTIHRVYILTNLKQSACTTLNKVYTMYSVSQTMHALNDTVKPDFTEKLFFMYPNDQVITNIIDNCNQILSAKISTVLAVGEI